MVELRDAVQGRWKALVVAVPLASALVAGLLFLGSDSEEWRASGELSIREYIAGQSAAEIRAATSSFDAALGSRAVLEEIAAVDPGQQGDRRIEITTATEGGEIEVELTADDPGRAEEALDVGVRRALSIVVEGEARRVTRQLRAADGAADDFIEILLEVEQRAGAASLADEAARRSADILSLRNQIAAAEGSAGVQQALQRTMEEKMDELAVIEQELLVWTTARTRLDLAVDSGANAALRLRQLTTELDDLASETLLTSVRTTEVSPLSDLLRVVVAAGAGAGFVVVVLALVSNSARSTGRERDQVVSDRPLDGRRPNAERAVSS